MPRKALIRSNTLPYHVTARANNREPFHLPMEVVWKTLEEHCFEIGLLYGIQVHAFLMMNNHFHLLMTTPNDDLGKVMMYFMRACTRSLNERTGRTGRVFGGRYHWSLIRSDLYFAHALKYVYRNPVRAGACGKVEEYPYSTLPGLLGETHQLLPIYFPFGSNGYLRIPSDTMQFLDWLNRPFQIEHQEAITKEFIG